MNYNRSEFRVKQIWKARVGKLPSRSSFLVNESNIFVGGAGGLWNVRDKLDCVTCLNIGTGQPVWTTPTLADVNEMCLVGSVLIVPTDSNALFIISIYTGEIIRIIEVDGAVVGKPLFVEDESGAKVIFASVNGNIYSLSLPHFEPTRIAKAPCGVIAALRKLSSSSFVAACIDGSILKYVRMREDWIGQQIAKAPTTKHGFNSQIIATPLVLRGKMFVTVVRNTYYDSLPIFCLDLETGREIWSCPAVSPHEHVGNCRVSPVFIAGKLVVIPAYTDGIHFLDPTDGRYLGKVSIGQSVFQQWSSPASIEGKYLSVGRVDGVCSFVDVESQQLITSISLAPGDATLSDLSHSHSDPEQFGLYPHDPVPSAGICAPVVAFNNTVLAGTAGGELFKLEWDIRDVEEGGVRVFIPDPTHGEGSWPEGADRPFSGPSAEFLEELEAEYRLRFRFTSIGTGAAVAAYFVDLICDPFKEGVALFFAGTAICGDFESWDSIFTRLSQFFAKSPSFDREAAAAIVFQAVTMKLGAHPKEFLLNGFKVQHRLAFPDPLNVPDPSTLTVIGPKPRRVEKAILYVFDVSVDSKRFRLRVDGHRVIFFDAG